MNDYYRPLPLTPPPEGTETPIVKVHGNRLSDEQLRQMQRYERPTRWLLISLVLLPILFGLSTIGLAGWYLGAPYATFVTGMLLISGGMMMLGRQRQNRAAEQQDAYARRLYAASTAGGVTTTVYPDRIEQRSSRVKKIVFFTEDTRFVEHAHWFFVETKGQRVIVAAADVTPWEAQAIYEHIARAIPPARQFQHRPFCPGRQTSVPPPFSTEPPVCYERVVYHESPRSFVWPHGLIPWLAATALSLGSVFTVLFQITPWFFLDYLLVFLACFFGLLLFSLRIVRRAKPSAPSPVVALSFTSHGLFIERQDSEEFAAAADIHARRTDDGVRLFTPAGVFTVPWSATTHRQQLEWMLFAQRPSSFE